MTQSPEGAGAQPGLPHQRPRLLLIVVLVSVVSRVAAALMFGDSVGALPGVDDQVSYHALAIRVLDGYGFSFGTGWWPATAPNQPTAHWSFLYVGFLAAVYTIFGPAPLAARLVQVLAVGLLQPLLAFRVTARLFGARAGLVCATLFACYAYFIYYSAALMTESFYIAAILWSLDRALAIADAAESPVRPRGALWLQLGFALAAAVLLRQVVVTVVPLVVMWAWWKARGRGGAGRRHWPATFGAVAAVLVVAAAVLPWTVRNYRAFHRIVLLNTNAGFAFYWGNHPIHGTSFVPILPGEVYSRLIPDDLRGLNEAEMERALLWRGMAFVKADPARFVRLSISRAKEYVKFWPARDSSSTSNWARALSFGVCLPFMVVGMFIATGRRRGSAGQTVSESSTAVGLLMGIAAVYSLVHLVSWTLVRYRLPVDALMLPFASLAIVRGWDRLAALGRRWSEDRVWT